MERCRREIAAIEDQLRAGHPDLQGLCLALVDWSEELRIIEAEPCTRPLITLSGQTIKWNRHAQRNKPPGLNPAAGRTDLRLGQALIE
jgi:hypothetical protein